MSQKPDPATNNKWNADSCCQRSREPSRNSRWLSDLPLLRSWRVYICETHKYKLEKVGGLWGWGGAGRPLVAGCCKPPKNHHGDRFGLIYLSVLGWNPPYRASDWLCPPSPQDDKYWQRRKKNNMAAKRSRDARRLKENQITVRAAFLERENAALRTEVAELRKECGRYKNVVGRYESKYGSLWGTGRLDGDAVVHSVPSCRRGSGTASVLRMDRIKSEQTNDLNLCFLVLELWVS